MRWQFSIRGLLLFTAYIAVISLLAKFAWPLAAFAILMTPTIFRRAFAFVQSESRRLGPLAAWSIGLIAAAMLEILLLFLALGAGYVFALATFYVLLLTVPNSHSPGSMMIVVASGCAWIGVYLLLHHILMQVQTQNDGAAASPSADMTSRVNASIAVKD